MDAPVSNKPCTVMLLMVRLYNIGVPVFTSSTFTLCMDHLTQSESLLIKMLHRCSAFLFCVDLALHHGHFPTLPYLYKCSFSELPA